jgi:hypothetical protein
MTFVNLPISELRDVTKKNIETLELWLRRVIDEALSKNYGPEYWKHQYANGDYLLNKGLREKVNKWYTGNSSNRFTRWIDASLIEHVSEIICNEVLYKAHFKYYFVLFFPKNFSIDSSRQYIKFIFEKCIDVRNRLYHSNPIGIRQAEQIACYSSDIIDSFKNYYIQNNMQNEFNTPSIIKYADSFGKEIYVNTLGMVGGTRVLSMNDVSARSGDRIRMSIELDSSFDNNEYSIKWDAISLGIIGTDKEIIIDLNDSCVSEHFAISVTVTSNKSWHRYGYFDDKLQISFTVLPPIS